jgi:IS4 transposase
MKIHRNQIINISLFSHLISDGGLFHHFELYLRAFSWVILTCWWLDRWWRNQGSVNLCFYFH